MKLKQRLIRLVSLLPGTTQAECTGGTMALVAEGEEPKVGPGTPRCRMCGGVHLLAIDEVVVEATGVVIG